MKRQPPRVVFVGWCCTCGGTIVADRNRQQAKDGSGCLCAVGKDRVKAVRYVLAPPAKRRRGA